MAPSTKRTKREKRCSSSRVAKNHAKVHTKTPTLSCFLLSPSHLHSGHLFCFFILLSPWHPPKNKIAPFIIAHPACRFGLQFVRVLSFRWRPLPNKTQQIIVCEQLHPLKIPPKLLAQAHLKRCGQMPPVNSQPNLPAPHLSYAPRSIRRGFAGHRFRWTSLRTSIVPSPWTYSAQGCFSW